MPRHVYRFKGSASGAATVGTAFSFTTGSTLLPSAAVDENKVATMQKPDLEWSVRGFNKIRTDLGVPAIDLSGKTPFSMGLVANCGSFQDDGIGEDRVPQTGAESVTWPCLVATGCMPALTAVPTTTTTSATVATTAQTAATSTAANSTETGKNETTATVKKTNTASALYRVHASLAAIAVALALN